MDDAILNEFEQLTRELVHEADTGEEFLTLMGFGGTCARCGQDGLDDDGYTDCELIPGPLGWSDPAGPDLLCGVCVTQGDLDRQAQEV